MNLASTAGTPNAVGEGFLCGLSQAGSAPGDSYVQPLNPNLMRGGAGPGGTITLHGTGCAPGATVSLGIEQPSTTTPLDCANAAAKTKAQAQAQALAQAQETKSPTTTAASGAYELTSVHALSTGSFDATVTIPSNTPPGASAL